MNEEIMSTVRKESGNYEGRARVRWLDQNCAPKESYSGPDLLDQELFHAVEFRKGKRYPRQASYQGLYYFTGVDRHIWHESRFESNLLRLLDHRQAVAAIASQPMSITFSDGSEHIPDFLAQHKGGRQTLYDVKPAGRVDEDVIAQFAKTQAVCALVGWDYNVFVGLPAQVNTNLLWLSHFRHPHFHPSAEAATRLLQRLVTPMSFLEAAVCLKSATLADARSALFHLLWLGTLSTDLSIQLTNTAEITGGPNAHA